jgi:hypothetical protein
MMVPDWREIFLVVEVEALMLMEFWILIISMIWVLSKLLSWVNRLFIMLLIGMLDQEDIVKFIIFIRRDGPRLLIWRMLINCIISIKLSRVIIIYYFLNSKSINAFALNFYFVIRIFLLLSIYFFIIIRKLIISFLL